MRVQFISRIRKGNKKGTGFFCIPKEKVNFFNLDDWVRVELSNNIYFFTKIIFYSHRLGVYIPKRIVKENGLLGKEVLIQMKRVDGFSAKVSSDGRIYLPKDIAEKQKFKDNEIVLIKAIEGNKIVQEKFSKISIRKKKNRSIEYYCFFDRRFQNKTLLFRIEKKPRHTAHTKVLTPLSAQLLRSMHYGWVSENAVVVFGHKIPAVINPNFQYSDLAFYLGAYFADGTKKGNSWAMCASTFEQAKYYLKMHNFLIKDSKPEFTISYTNVKGDTPKEIKRKLAKIWERRVGIKVNKFRIRKPTGKSSFKWNEHGTLIIREGRQILLDVYNELLKILIEIILTKRNKKLAIDFICGVMEGDGCAPSKRRGHITIWTNKNDIPILENILRVAEIKFKTLREDKNKRGLRIGALEILRNFSYLKDKIFILYPKRRKAFFERLKAVGAVKFLIENHKSTNWIKALLRKRGFCDKNYQLTDKGLKLRNELIANINKTTA